MVSSSSIFVYLIVPFWAWLGLLCSHHALAFLPRPYPSQSNLRLRRWSSSPKFPHEERGCGLHLWKGEHHDLADYEEEEDNSSTSSSNDNEDNEFTSSLHRRFLLTTTCPTVLAATATLVASSSLLSPTQPAHALFEGGVGGLGKTKPETGVVFLNSDGMAPAQQTNKGVVSAELLISGDDDSSSTTGDVALVSFVAPWPLLTTAAGLEARDLSTSDAAFCQVVVTDSASSSFQSSSSSSVAPKQAAAQLQAILQDSVLAPRGKFGMYGAPSSIKVKPVATDSSDSSASNNNNSLFVLSFTALTPAMRESDRAYYVSVQTLPIASSKGKGGNGVALLLLLVGTTAARFAKQQAVLRGVAQSWQVVPAPKTGRATR